MAEGHRALQQKTCSSCKETFHLGDFYGKSPRCQECSKATGRRSYVKNREAILERARLKRLAMSPAERENERKYNLKYRAKRREQNKEQDIYVRTRARARRKAIPFDLDAGDFKIPDICPVLRIPIDCTTRGVRGPRDTSPSMDRIDPQKGYVKGNVRIISFRANQLKSNATLEELGLVFADLQQLLATEIDNG